MAEGFRDSRKSACAKGSNPQRRKSVPHGGEVPRLSRTPLSIPRRVHGFRGCRGRGQLGQKEAPFSDRSSASRVAARTLPPECPGVAALRKSECCVSVRGNHLFQG